MGAAPGWWGKDGGLAVVLGDSSCWEEGSLGVVGTQDGTTAAWGQVPGASSALVLRALPVGLPRNSSQSPGRTAPGRRWKEPHLPVSSEYLGSEVQHAPTLHRQSLVRRSAWCPLREGGGQDPVGLPLRHPR